MIRQLVLITRPGVRFASTTGTMPYPGDRWAKFARHIPIVADDFEGQLDYRMCDWATALGEFQFAEEIPLDRREKLVRQIDGYQRWRRSQKPRSKSVYTKFQQLDEMAEILTKHALDEPVSYEESQDILSRFHRERLRTFSNNVCRAISLLQDQTPRLRANVFPTEHELELSEEILDKVRLLIRD